MCAYADDSDCAPSCGDSYCDLSLENCVTCSFDCGFCVQGCGDGTCDFANSENAANCPADCQGVCVPVPSGLVGWWSGDGYAFDLTGNNKGIAQNVSYAAGKVGQAFSFNGVDSYVNIQESGANLDGFSELTIDAWINPDIQTSGAPAVGQGVIVSKYDTTITDGFSYFLALDQNGIITFHIRQSDSPAVGAGVVAVNPINIGAWSHITAVWAGGSNVILYINGSQARTTAINYSQAPAVLADNNVPVNIGRAESFSGGYTGPGGYFKGLIDEVEIFNYALTQAEVEAIHAADSTGKCKPLCNFNFTFPCILN
jgi:hypothetical protein